MNWDVSLVTVVNDTLCKIAPHFFVAGDIVAANRNQVRKISGHLTEGTANEFRIAITLTTTKRR